MEKLILSYYDWEETTHCSYTFEYESLEKAKEDLIIAEKTRNEDGEFAFLGETFGQYSMSFSVCSLDTWFDANRIDKIK